MKRGSSGINVLVAIDKPQGISSHDVVNRVRSCTREGRVGHCGTLDPDATGVLIVGIGSAARLSNYLIGHDKTYRARISFGTATNTDDAQGEVVDTAEVPDEVYDPVFAVGFVAGLVGRHLQTPPAFCAIKQNGRTAYKAARAGDSMELAPRPVEIFSASLSGISISENDGVPLWDLELSVSKGTYIRALARDLGEALGTRAHLCGLRRIRSGSVGIEQTVSLEELDSRGAAACALDPVSALGFPRAIADEACAGSICNGRRISDSEPGIHLAALADVQPGDEDRLVSVVSDGRLVAVCRYRAGSIKAETVFNGGVGGVTGDI